MVVVFRITTTQGPDLQFSEFISKGIPSDTLQEIIDAINYLEQTGLFIQNNTHELFDVIVNGERYTVVDENPTINAGVSCKSGFVVTDGICAACPAGTYFAENTCLFCEKGKYQPNTGETTCIPCPAWQTTNTIDSTKSSQCKSYEYATCSLYPCNGHVCVDKQDGYICTCHDGWSGTNCDTPPDFCIGNACVNGATCRSETTNYTCLCLPGYTGQYCEISQIDGVWSEWSLSECSKSCGTGVVKRTRTCDSPVPDTNGADCIGDAIETVPCNNENCPVDGGWSEWSYSECSKVCGAGSMNRIRKCDNPVPQSNGAECVGDAKETIACNTDTCQVDDYVVAIAIIIPVVAFCIVFALIAFVIRKMRNRIPRQEETGTDQDYGCGSDFVKTNASQQQKPSSDTIQYRSDFSNSTLHNNKESQ